MRQKNDKKFSHNIFILNHFPSQPPSPGSETSSSHLMLLRLAEGLIATNDGNNRLFKHPKKPTCFGCLPG